MKKYIWGISIGAAVLIVGAFILGRFAFPNLALSSLPKPELSEGERGQLGIDKNINEATIDNYLNRADAVYRDVRMLKDPGNYEAIGGDSYLSGFVEGFEVVPLPYLVNVTGLPEAVGATYTGKTLFTNKDGKYIPNYEESVRIMEDLFPKDKVIFLMCGGGGYSGMLKNMLVALGWDETKIYDVGGYWFYEGEHKVEVKRELPDGKVVYDFYRVPYHEIDFSALHKAEVGQLVEVTAPEYSKMIAEGRSFLLMVDQGGCNTADQLRKFMQDYLKNTGQIGYKIYFDEMKETSLYDKVKFYPSAVVVQGGEVMAWLKADSDEDSARYNDEAEFSRWMTENR